MLGRSRLSLPLSLALAFALAANALPGCAPVGDDAAASPAAVVTITARDIARLAPGASLRVDLTGATRYRFDAGAGAIDLSRVEVADASGRVLPMDAWLRAADRAAPRARVFELAGRDAPAAAPDGVSVEELRILRIVVIDPVTGEIVAIIYIIER